MDSMNDCFCAKYLGNKQLFPEIQSQTINILCNYGFDCFETLISLDFDLDMPLIIDLVLGQKVLVRKALKILREEYSKCKFDYNNENEFNQFVDRIKDIVTHERNDSSNAVKLALNQWIGSVCSRITDQCLTSFDNHIDDKVLNGFPQNPIQSSFNSKIVERTEEIDFGTDEEYDEEYSEESEVSEDSEEMDSDFENTDPNEIDWLAVKSSMAETDYENLKKTSSLPIISLKRCPLE